MDEPNGSERSDEEPDEPCEAHGRPWLPNEFQQQNFFSMFDWVASEDQLSVTRNVVALEELIDGYGLQYRHEPQRDQLAGTQELGVLLTNIVVRAGTRRVVANFDDVRQLRADGLTHAEVVEYTCTDEEELLLGLAEIRRLKRKPDWPRRFRVLLNRIEQLADASQDAADNGIVRLARQLRDLTGEQWGEVLDLDRTTRCKVAVQMSPEFEERVRADEISVWQAYHMQHLADRAEAAAPPASTDELASKRRSTLLSDTDAILEEVFDILGGFLRPESCRRAPAAFLKRLEQAAIRYRTALIARHVPGLAKPRRGKLAS